MSNQPIPSLDRENNLLLRSVSGPVWARMSAAAQLVDLPHGKVLWEPEQELTHLYFPLHGAMVSMISVTEEGDLAEVGIVGWEGVVDFNAFLRRDQSMYRALVQLPGKGIRLRTEVVRREFDSDMQFRNSVLRFVNFFVVQVSQTALCNRLHTVEERLARWLLMTRTRSASQDMPLTHEMLAHMLGTRRSTVSLTAATLQAAGLIRYSRGNITILDPKKLADSACSCYPMVQRQFEMLLENQQ
jgi:CRP-like cAMP-binding protein